MGKIFRVIVKSVFVGLLIFLGISKSAPAQPSAPDSLNFYLAHIKTNTADNDLKKAIDKVQALPAGNTIHDSLIAYLLHTEEVLLNVIYENGIMNFNPFNNQIVFSFGEKLVSLCRQLPPKNESLYYAAALNNLGVLYGYFSKGQKGNVLIEKAFSIKKKNLSEDDSDYAESLINMAQINWSKGNKETLDLAQKALILTKKEGLKFQINHAKCLFFLALAYKDMHRYDEAARFHDEELELQKKMLGAESARFALRCYFTGDMYMYLLKYEKALELFKQAINITQKTLGENNLQYAYCLDGLASAYYRKAEYQTAVPLYLQSLQIKEQLFRKDYADNALSLHNLAVTYQQMGDYAHALPLLENAANISKKAAREGVEFDYNHAFSIDYLASLYQTLGQYSDALPLLQYAATISKKALGQDHHYYASALNNLATLYATMHRYDSALFYYKKVLQIKEKNFGKNHPEYAASLDNLAGVYKKMGRYEMALNLCTAALQIRKQALGEKSPAYAVSLNNLGELYMQKGKYDSAANLLDRSLAIRKQIFGNEHPDVVKSLNSLALLHHAAGNNTKAAVLFIEANNTELKNISRTYTALSEQQKLNFIHEDLLQFCYLPSLLYKNVAMPTTISDQVYRNSVALKGMVLEDQQQVFASLRQYADDSIQNIFRQWQQSRSLLGQQLLLPVKQRMADLDSLEKQATHVEQQLSRYSATLRTIQQSDNISPKIVSQNLKPGEAAIEFVRFNFYNKKWTDSTLYAAIIVLPGDSACRFIPLFEEKELQQILQPAATGNPWAVNKLYSDAMSSVVSYNTAKSLYTLIWKPLEKHLANVNTIWYAPAGLLHRVAFNALPCNAGHWLIDKYQLTQVANTRSLALPRLPFSNPNAVCIWGNIQYNSTDTSQSLAIAGAPAMYSKASSLQANTLAERETKTGSWPPLPGTKLEMDSLKNMFTNAGISNFTVSDTNATEERFKTFDGKSPQVLHIATHGFFVNEKKLDKAYSSYSAGNAFKAQANSMFRSGLVLAGGNNAWKNNTIAPGREDGILTAYDIAHLDLSQTDLAVLSACNSALGDVQGNEGVIGLQRAFRLAGVRQLVMSLWKIPDTQTTELMALFYTNWLSGQSPAEAL